jgi:hypothetical protein
MESRSSEVQRSSIKWFHIGSFAGLKEEMAEPRNNVRRLLTWERNRESRGDTEAYEVEGSVVSALHVIRPDMMAASMALGGPAILGFLK